MRLCAKLPEGFPEEWRDLLVYITPPAQAVTILRRVEGAWLYRLITGSSGTYGYFLVADNIPLSTSTYVDNRALVPDSVAGRAYRRN